MLVVKGQHYQDVLGRDNVPLDYLINQLDERFSHDQQRVTAGLPENR